MATYSNTAFQFFSITTTYFITFMAKNCLIHLFIYLLVHITPINFTIPRKEASLYPLYQPPGSSCCSGSGERWRQLFTPSTVPGDCYLYQPRSQRTALRFLVISQFTTVFPFPRKHAEKTLTLLLPFTFYKKQCSRPIPSMTNTAGATEKLVLSCPVLELLPSTLHDDTWITTSDAVG